MRGTGNAVAVRRRHSDCIFPSRNFAHAPGSRGTDEGRHESVRCVKSLLSHLQGADRNGKPCQFSREHPALQLRFMQPLNPFVSPALSFSRCLRIARLVYLPPTCMTISIGVGRTDCHPVRRLQRRAALLHRTWCLANRWREIEDGIDRQWIDPDKKW